MQDLNNILKVDSIIMKRPYVDILSQDFQLGTKTQSKLQSKAHKAHKSKYKQTFIHYFLKTIGAPSISQLWNTSSIESFRTKALVGVSSREWTVN